MDPKHLYDYIIVPVLDHLDLYSLAAARLVLGTAMVESDLRWLRQLRGPAMGLFQMEPDTHDDIWEHWLRYRRDLARRVVELAGRWPPHTGPVVDSVLGLTAPGAPVLIGNLNYAAAMCRVHYRRRIEPLPRADNPLELAEYHKSFYNTFLGATKVSESAAVFERVIGITSEGEG